MTGRARLPRTTELVWPMLALVGGVLLAFMAWATLTYLEIGPWRAPLQLALGGGLAAALLGLASALIRRGRALRGTRLGRGPAGAYAWPAIVGLLFLAFILALWPMPYRWEWVSTLVTVLCVVGALLIALSLARSGPSPLLSQAQRAFREGHDEKAQALLKQLAEDSPDDYGLHYLTAMLQRHRRHYEQALQSCDRLIALRPELYFGHAERGLTLLATGATVEGLEALEKAVAIAPNLSQAHFNLGVARAEVGEAAGALPALARALRLGLRDDVARMIARHHLVCVLVSLGHQQRARKEWRRLRRQRRTLRQWRIEGIDSHLLATARHGQTSLAAEIERAMTGPPGSA